MKALYLLAAALLPSSALAAPDDLKVCEAIPAGDVESAVGIKVVSAKPGYHECTWQPAEPDRFVSATALKRAQHTLSGANEYAAQMKSMGFTITVTDETPDLWCAKAVPPPNMSAQFVECRALTKGHYFEVHVVGPDSSREKAKALVSKMAARLP